MQKIELNKEQFKLLNAVVKSAISTPNSSRPILEFAKIEITKTDITCIALDGFRMSVLKLDIESESEPFECFYQPIANFPSNGKVVSIEKIDDKKCTVAITCENGSVQVTDVKQPSEEYVRWRQVLPQECRGAKIGFSPKLLAEALAPYKTAEYVVLDFATKGKTIDPAQPLLISAHIKNAELTSLVMPLRIK